MKNKNIPYLFLKARISRFGVKVINLKGDEMHDNIYLNSYNRRNRNHNEFRICVTVLNDIAGIMLNQQFLDELFKPQEVYSKAALRSLFHDLAHASIMRLNETSMSKLYDLMMMVFKQQVFFATQPKDLILITLNHLDSMRYLVSSPAIYKQLDATYFLIIKASNVFVSFSFVIM